ncbi:dTMP kinase [Candidatus Microgenomates bacterium]|nr:dTMP kinase [Candidatus Microgenomates bacterium]
MSSLFISFEGLEGSGKSTQAGLLAGLLKEKGFPVIATREPGGTRIGESIRAITHGKENVDLTAAAEAYLMAASRAQHVREIIKPALESDKIVICDRFLDSSLAYQGYGRGLGETTIFQLNNLAINLKNVSKADVGQILPDITFFLDISPEVGFARRNNTDKIDRLDLQQKDFYQRVWEGYKKLAEKYKERYITIDSSKPIKEVAETIWTKIESHLVR